MKIRILIISFFILLNCQPKKQKSVPVVKNFNNEKTMKKQLNFSEIKKITLKEAINIYGKPITQEDFILEDIAINEFRIRLYNFFSKKELNESIRLKEITWEIKKDSLITVWYKKEGKDNWNPIDGFKYIKYTDF